MTTVDHLRGLSPRLASRALALVGAGALLLALALPWAGRVVPWPEVTLRGLWPTAIVLGITGALMVAWRVRPLRVPLSAGLVGFAVANLLAALWIAPCLDPIMSPRPQAQAIADYVERGYRPLVFKTFPGTYTYYAGRDLPETRDPAILRRHVRERTPVVVTMARKHWERHAAVLADLTIVHEQLIETRPFIVAVRPAPPEAGGR